MTPEGRVKQNISRILASFPFVYPFMPVQYGMGAAGVDYHCVAGKYFILEGKLEMVPVAFFIEAKKPGDKPTDRQANFARDRKKGQNAVTFVIDEDPSIRKGSGLAKLTEWLEAIEKNNEYLRSTFTQ
jgi:hypothetical protein